jgi:hypothetical protein
LKGSINYQSAHLDFTVSANENVQYYSLERSLDGKKFSTVKVLTSNGDMGLATYLTDDDISQVEGSEVYYRIKMTRSDGSIRYSEALLLSRPMERMDGFTILPNPVSSKMQILIIADKKQVGVVKIFNALGSLVEMKSISLGSGNNIIGFEGLEKWSSGLYPVQVQVGEKLYTQKMIISRNK